MRFGHDVQRGALLSEDGDLGFSQVRLAAVGDAEAEAAAVAAVVLGLALMALQTSQGHSEYAIDIDRRHLNREEGEKEEDGKEEGEEKLFGLLPRQLAGSVAPPEPAFHAEVSIMLLVVDPTDPAHRPTLHFSQIGDDLQKFPAHCFNLVAGFPAFTFYYVRVPSILLQQAGTSVEVLEVVREGLGALVERVHVGVLGQDGAVVDSAEDDGDHGRAALHDPPEEAGLVVLADVGLEDEEEGVEVGEVGDALGLGAAGARHAAPPVHVHGDMAAHLAQVALAVAGAGTKAKAKAL